MIKENPASIISNAFLAIFTLLSFPSLALAESNIQRCENPTTPEDVSFCENREPQRQRFQPNFSEEVRVGFDDKGFSSTFLGDALNGISDPLGGGTVGGGDVESLGLGDISPIDRGLIPAFDPTDVIIPTSGVRK